MCLASKDVAEILHKASTSQRELDERRERLSLMAQHQHRVTVPVAHAAQSLIHSAQIDRAATINVMKSLLIGDLRHNVNQLRQSQESQSRLCDLVEDCLTSNELINNLEAYLRDGNLVKRQYCLDQGSQGNWMCIRTNRSEIALPTSCLILQKNVSSCFFELSQKIMLYSLDPELRRLSPRLRPLHPSLLSATVNEEGTEINLVIDIPVAANHNEPFKIDAYGYRIHPSSSSASHEQQEEVHIFSESSHSSSSSSSSMIRQQPQWSCSPMTSPSTHHHLLGLKIPIINAREKKRGGLVAGGGGGGGKGGLSATGEGLAAGGGGEGGGVQANDGRPSHALTIHLSIQC